MRTLMATMATTNATCAGVTPVGADSRRPEVDAAAGAPGTCTVAGNGDGCLTSRTAPFGAMVNPTLRNPRVFFTASTSTCHRPGSRWIVADHSPSA